MCVCVMSVYCVCVTGEAQLVFVILIEAPPLSMDSLCCTQVSRLYFPMLWQNNLEVQNVVSKTAKIKTFEKSGL